MGFHQGGNVGFQNVSKDQREVLGAAHGFLQNGLEGGVNLYGDHPACIFTQGLGQGANAGANLQHAAAFVNSRAIGNLTGHPALGQKVLPLGFGKTEAVLLQQGLDDVDITEIHEKPAFCRNIGGGFTLIIWETAAKCKREIRDGLAAGVLCCRLTFESSSSNTQSAAQSHW